MFELSFNSTVAFVYSRQKQREKRQEKGYMRRNPHTDEEYYTGHATFGSMYSYGKDSTSSLAGNGPNPYDIAK